MTLPEDTILENRYRIDRLLAQGGMGAIYKAFDTNLKTPVAIKENFYQTPESIQQFEQEALILARLRHPGLPRVIHHFSAEGFQYLVMDYIEGQDLWEIVKAQQAPLDEKLALQYIIQIADAVHYLHRQTPPIIHRDIKPQNIKITPDNQAVLVDFGIAKVGGDDTRTRTGARGVTPGFSPPEQYSGMGTTVRSDVYSLGATLYAVLTAKKPPDSISLLVGGAKFEPPNILNPRLSPGVARAIEHAMQVQQDDRPQNAADWKKELQHCLDALINPSDKATLAGAKRADVEETMAGAHAAAFWLVDRTKLGFPLGPAPLVIGRHSQADVPIKVLSASREHAFVKAEGGKVYVRDNDSANGTFVNDEQISPGWHVIKPGDVVSIGTTRFTVSDSKPAKVATVAPKPRKFDDDDKIDTVKPATPAAAGAPPPGTPAAPAVEKTAASTPKATVVSEASGSKIGLPLITGVIAAIVVIAVIGGVAFFWLRSGGSTTPAPSATLAAKAPEATGEAPTIVTEEAEAVDASASATAQAQQALSASQAEQTQTAQASAAETSQAETQQAAAPTNTPAATTQEPVATQAPPTATPTLPPPTQTFTPAATPTSAPVAVADTPTPTQPPPTPRPAGPTVIPVETIESIAEIGNVPVTAVEINPQNPREVYALVKGSVNGIFKSSNGGDGPWGRLDIDASGITDFVIDPTNPARFFAPAWNAVIRSDDAGNSWQAFGNGLSTANRVVDVVEVDPITPNVLYGGIGSTLVVSTDGGASWVSDGFGNGLGQGRLTSIEVDPFNHDVVFVGGEFGSIYKSVDSGRTFQQLAFNSGRGTYSITANPAKRDEFLAGINSFDAAIIKTTNAADFQSTSNGLIFGGADSAYSAIRYAPGNANIVYAGSGYESDADAKGIFKSVDGGKSWSRVSNGLRVNPTTGQPHYVRDIAVHPTNPDIVLAATGWGLYQSTDGGANWTSK